jgi:cold shock CspA family protein
MSKSKASFAKREKEMKRMKERQEKQDKMQERKAAGKSGKSLNDMMAYLDENGNLSSVPPDPAKQKTFKVEDMQIGVPKYEPSEEELVRSGVVDFFNESKGFGFINDDRTRERIFMHVSRFLEPIAEGDRVTFDVERGDRGFNAVNIKKLS